MVIVRKSMACAPSPTFLLPARTLRQAGEKTCADFMLPERDPGPLARLAEVMADESVPGVVFGRLTEGKTLREIARVWRVPRGRFVQWFMENHADLYDAADRVWCDQMKHEALENADAATAEDVAPRKLRVDTRLRLMEKLDRARYGARESALGGGITVLVDRSCGGAVAVQAGGSTVMVGGVSPRRAIEGTEALPVETAEDI